jgi:hypothetical protein
MKLRVAIPLAVLSAAAHVTGAQSSSGNATMLNQYHSTIVVNAASGVGIKNLPYTALTKTRRSSTLADGTHIDDRGDSSRQYRDSEGRTRLEIYARQQGESNVPPDTVVIMINDPVSGKRYTINPHTRTATEFQLPGSRPQAVASTLTAASDGNTSAQITDPVATASGSKPEIRVESLGTQSMSGVDVVGTRVTRTYPVGSIGNDRDIVVETTTWHSPDLGIDILRTTIDPRMGITTTRVSELSRDDPDPSLFQVPPDHTITPAPSPELR